MPCQQVDGGLNNSARVVGDGGKVVMGDGMGGVDTVDGSAIASLYHSNDRKQQQALHYRKLEHQVCAVCC